MRKMTLCAVGVLALGALLSGPAFAQGGFGGKGGINIANLSLSDETGLTDKTARTGVVAGIYGFVKLGQTFALQAEGLYSQQGFKATDAGETATLKTDYFQIPVLAKIMVPTDGSVAPNFFLGPAVSFEASCKLAGDDGQGTSVDLECDDPLVDFARKTTDFGLIGGVGLDIIASAILVGFEVRYNLGLTNLDDSGFDDTAKSRVLAIMGNIAFYSPGN
jgi:hypothetical protein